ncbi:MAG: ATP-binding protein [Saprospiraceae bacterium]
MKLFVLIITIFLGRSIAFAQDGTIERLKQKLITSTTDSSKSSTLDSLSMYYLFFSNQPDSTYHYANESINLAYKFSDKKFLILAYARMGFYYINTTQFKAALDISLKGISLSEEYHIPDYLSALYYNTAWVYYNLNDIKEAMLNAKKGIGSLKDDRDSFYDQALHINGIIGNILLDTGKPDSAFFYFTIVDSMASVSREKAAKDIADWYWSMYYMQRESYKIADSILSVGIINCQKNGDFLLNFFFIFSAQSNIGQGKIEKAIDNARSAFHLSLPLNDPAGARISASLLTYCFEQSGKRDSAYHYLKISDSLRAAISRNSNANEIQQIRFDQQLGQKEKEATQILMEQKNRNRITLYVFITALLFFFIIAGIQWRNNRHRKKANILLQEQKNKAESTLTELKATQSQLIQSEKMASLGELTAGIAHEIQNPLNFVNNFSEVNTELIKELSEIRSQEEEVRDEELGGRRKRREEEDAIISDLKSNSEKINHHGQRASSIVKGMLEHSRASTGLKVLTDINALADEYLRLSYHGLRAKEKGFNAVPIAIGIKTDFDPDLPKIEVVPQDFGRVLLNLINNAFQAVDEKARKVSIDFKPLVTVSTKLVADHIEIIVRDNGSGIPDSIKDKIFQPFFTTKPTGQGTGLGLSLAYDIIKAHSGEIKVDTKEARPPARSDHSGGDDPVGRGEGLPDSNRDGQAGTEFIIQLRTN